jgi:hypothetical protein
MKLESSLPCTQEPATEPLTEPDESSPHEPISYDTLQYHTPIYA